MGKIIVIGAGPAGIMAALTAAKKGESVLLIERNKQAARKLFISGSGQCNLTHSGDISSFSLHYGEKSKVAFRILRRFSNEDLIDFFKNLGLPLKKRDDGKYFPKSLKSSNVISCLLKTLESNAVQLILNNSVISIEKSNNVFLVTTKKEKYTAKCVICATGGFTYPKTGSDGKFFSIIEKMNHHIVPLGKGLSPIFTKDNDLKRLAGISFKNAAIGFKTKNNKPINARGELLVTHHGFSGPLILDYSRYFQKGMKIHLNFTPFKDRNELEKQMIAYTKAHGKNTVVSFFQKNAIPKRLIITLFQRINIDMRITFSQLSSPNRKQLSEVFADYKTTIESLGNINESMVTTGGIDLKEIKLSTMESKIIKGLYFCGEMIDIDGDSGGYNIQMAFSTGFIAGQATSQSA